MPTRKKKISTKAQIKGKKKAEQVVIDYERIMLLIAPPIIIGIIILTIWFVENNTLPKLREFLIHKGWDIPVMRETTDSAINETEEDPTVIVADPPVLPDLDENQNLPEILEDLDLTISQMTQTDGFSLALVIKIRNDAAIEMQNGNETVAREKLILSYKLAQEMFFAYQNKLNRFRESTASAD